MWSMHQDLVGCLERALARPMSRYCILTVLGKVAGLVIAESEEASGDEELGASIVVEAMEQGRQFERTQQVMRKARRG